MKTTLSGRFEPGWNRSPWSASSIWRPLSWASKSVASSTANCTLRRPAPEQLPPAILVTGAASYTQKLALPRGAELRVELLDVTQLPAGEILAEQVVRSGWQVPIPFALRVPKDMKLDNRKLVLTARLVVLHQVLFQLAQPRAIAFADLGHPIELLLDQVEAPKR